MNAVVEVRKPSMIADMAGRYGIEPGKFAATVKATCLPANVSDEEFAAFLMVAKEYDLNPILKEIFAFPKKGGGIQPIVSIDGWMNLINSHPKMDGMEFVDAMDKAGKLVSITCSIFRKDRSRPVVVTEYMAECHRPTEPWQKWPARMLRHKAAIQCARYAFGFAGIIDQDEAERSPDVITEAVVAPPPPQVTHQPEPVDVAAEEAEAVEMPTAFLEEIETALAVAADEATIEEAWAALDVEATLRGNDDARAIADRIKVRHLSRILPDAAKFMMAG